MKTLKMRDIPSNTILLLVIIGTIFFALFPIYWAVAMSFKPADEWVTTVVHWWPWKPTIAFILNASSFIIISSPITTFMCEIPKSYNSSASRTLFKKTQASAKSSTCRNTLNGFHIPQNSTAALFSIFLLYEIFESRLVIHEKFLNQNCQ